MKWRGAALALAALSFAAAQPRKALLIGNGKYQSLTHLQTPSNDVRLLRQSLARAGFLVQVAEDLGIDRLDAEIRQFSGSLHAGDVGLFYYAGYGAHVEGENYLLPIDYNLNSDINSAAYSATRIVQSDLGGRRVSLAIAIFDANYEEANLDKRFHEPGFALMDARKPGIFLGFAASSRQANKMFPGRASSPFAEALGAAIVKPGLSISQVFEEAKRTVSGATQGEQIPATISTVLEDFYFIPKKPDLEEWERLGPNASRDSLEQFRRRFPDSPYAAEALKRIEELDEKARKERELADSRKIELEKQRQEAERRKEIEEQKRLLAAALEQFVAAHRERDIQKLLDLWPAMGRQRMSAFQDYFRANRIVRYEATPVGEPQFNGDSATVRCRQSIQGMTGGPIIALIELRFRKTGSSMVIESFNVIK